jgi:hypothetical protein
MLYFIYCSAGSIAGRDGSVSGVDGAVTNGGKIEAQLRICHIFPTLTKSLLRYCNDKFCDD